MINFLRTAAISIRAVIRRLAFDSRFHQRQKNRRHIVVCGDSHAAVFHYLCRRGIANSILFDVVKVNGATAQGMVNPNSKTNAMEIFRNRIEQMKPWQELFIQLGEVDCGFVIWHYAEKNNIPVEQQFKRSIKNYRAMVEWALSLGISRITLLSAPPPTIADGQTWGEIANARKGISASQLERTSLTIRYNEELARMADDLDLDFLDITSCMLAPETGLVGSEYMNADPLDHHLDHAKYGTLIVQKLKATESQPPSSEPLT